MALVTRREVELAGERIAVGDVPWLVRSCLDLLDVVEKYAPHLNRAAEHAAQSKTVEELRALAASRAHLTHDSTPERLANEEERLHDLTTQPTVADPDLGPEQNPVVDADPDRGPKTKVAEHPPPKDPDAEILPPYDAGTSAPTDGAHPGVAAEDDSADHLTLADLKKKAGELGIPGRSKMDRDELADAVAAAG